MGRLLEKQWGGFITGWGEQYAVHLEFESNQNYLVPGALGEESGDSKSGNRAKILCEERRERRIKERRDDRPKTVRGLYWPKLEV